MYPLRMRQTEHLLYKWDGCRIYFRNFVYHEPKMRRVLSILFIALFGFAPFAALAAGDDAHLPACCRRHGAHHCFMPGETAGRIIAANSGKTPLIGAPSHCPLFPGTQGVTVSSVFALAPQAAAYAALLTAERLHAVSTGGVQASPVGERSVRGPPSSFLG